MLRMPPSPRQPSMRRQPARKMPVRWSFTTSRSRMGRPPRMAMAEPSPVQVCADAALGGAAEAARGDDDGACAKAVDGAVFHAPGDAAEALAVARIVRSRAKYSTKRRQSNFSALPPSVCRMAWPAATAQR